MPRTVAPYGTWTSPITALMTVESAVRLSDVTVEGGWVYWIENRPSEAGRQVVVRCRPNGDAREDVLPDGFSARSQVHEYGGRCYVVRGDTVVFSNWADQRLWLIEGPRDPRPITPEPAEPAQPRGDRYADPVVTPDGRWLICVRERHRPGTEAVNDLAFLPLSPPMEGAAPRPLTGGHDFYSSPRVSPDGTRVAWITWDHPDMPWDSAELWVAGLTTGEELALVEPRRIAGGPGESVAQPRWSPAGVLHYVSDRTGWWNIYDETGRALCREDAEFAGPDWTFGNSSYAFLPDATVVATWGEGGTSHLGIVADGRADALDVPFTSIHYVQATDGAVAAIAGSPTDAPAVVVIDPLSGKVETLRRSRDRAPDPRYVSVPEAVEFPTEGGATAYALFYPPVNGDFTAPDGELPPLLVIVHGGPTGATSPVLSLDRVQFWTSRGFAVADVDYRGSVGHGRPYREALKGAWGVADVEDCAAAVRWLAAQGRVDGARAVIRGGSAGGFTALAALAFTDAFAGAASVAGVADLELLARDTHKFESRYLDGLVGPFPEAVEQYRRRSPIYHTDRIDGALILFQGLQDPVVPPAQAETMYRALTERGVDAEYHPFEGEQHGFRRASTIIEVAEAELAFYGRVLGFSPRA